MCTVSTALLACSPMLAAKAEQNPVAAPDSQQLDRKFQAASADYDAGHFAEAAAQLENLLREGPQSFEVHELLGLA